MVQDSTSNQMIGQMRMQFWRDAIRGINDVLVYYFLARRAETHFGRLTGAAPEASNCACLARGFAAFPSTNVSSQTDYRRTSMSSSFARVAPSDHHLF